MKKDNNIKQIVVTTTITVIVTAIITAIIAYIKGIAWKQIIIDVFVWGRGKIIGLFSAQISLWWIVLVIFLCIVFVQLKKKLKTRSNTSTSISLMDYNSDVLFDVLWTWRWLQRQNGYDFVTGSLHPICPKCLTDFQTTNQIDNWYSHSSIAYICEHCGFITRFQGSSEKKFKTRVENEIIRIVRSREWVERVKNRIGDK